MLALVRMLANLRPVELWCVIAIGQQRFALEPLRPARHGCRWTWRAARTYSRIPACFGRSATGRSNTSSIGRGWNGDWAFGDHGLHVRTAAESYRRLLKPGSDVLFIPPVHLNDLYLTQPAQWLRAMIARHGGVQLEAA